MKRLLQFLGQIRVRLLVVNLVVLLVPSVGLEFARVYERQLLDGLERDMFNQVALVRAALVMDLNRGVPLDDKSHTEFLRTAASRTRTRVRILDADAGLLVDSHAQGAPEGPEPAPPSLLPLSDTRVQSVRGRMARMRTTAWPDIARRIEVRQALEGKRAARTRLAHDPPAVFFLVAEPIRHQGKVIGVVYAVRSTSPVLFELHRIRKALLVVLLICFAVTATLTLLLAWTISRPLRRLANAAKRIAQGERNVPVPVGGSGEIRELGEAFSVMTTRLDDRLRYISEFAADVAHEFKSPLTSIRGAAELLEEGAADDPETRQRFLRNIELDTERLDRLVSRLLELSRIEASEGEMSDVDLARLLEATCERADSVDVRVTLTYRAHGRFVRGRATELETAFSNLIENAVRFSPPESHVNVVATKVGKQLQIDVIDSGPGVPAGDQGRIFQRFFTTEGDQGGTGLGLAIVKTVIEAHGGSVGVISEGPGTTMRVTLPLRA